MFEQELVNLKRFTVYLPDGDTLDLILEVDINNCVKVDMAISKLLSENSINPKLSKYFGLFEQENSIVLRKLKGSYCVSLNSLSNSRRILFRNWIFEEKDLHYCKSYPEVKKYLECRENRLTTESLSSLDFENCSVRLQKEDASVTHEESITIKVNSLGFHLLMNSCPNQFNWPILTSFQLNDESIATPELTFSLDNSLSDISSIQIVSVQASLIFDTVMEWIKIAAVKEELFFETNMIHRPDSRTLLISNPLHPNNR